uniref:Mediator of RNA polymerase II transcription subunit 31 n=1 Tax=Bicosoecida sp. CB-2014 TaxID=1486930 RepID=A0A7S1CQY1_9STRA|mmetsp:Transcript_8133/g.28925  ORF Transcript_8133/g.28925 Transcript_8133/m.28925 type:complete len:166 (+) Transcript_8133:59-556(+)
MEVDGGAAGGGAGGDAGAGDGGGGGVAPAWEESAAAAKERFEVELEFVQCLSNPRYLMYLAREGLLADPAFIAYLDYLKYWKRPEYVTFIRYPQSLYFLDRLQDPVFRAEAKNPLLIETIVEQQYYHWAKYRHNRDAEEAARAAEAAADGDEAAGDAAVAVKKEG